MRRQNFLLLVILAFTIGACCTAKYKSKYLKGTLVVSPPCLSVDGGKFLLSGAVIPYDAKGKRKVEVTVGGRLARELKPLVAGARYKVSGPLEPGTQEVVVTLCGMTLSTTIEIVEAPIIERISAEPTGNDVGSVCGGYLATIDGLGFLPDATLAVVGPGETPFFDNIVSISATQITGRVASHKSWGEGPFPVTVLVYPPGCGGIASNEADFTYTQAECGEPTLALLNTLQNNSLVGIGDFNNDGHNDILTGDRNFIVYWGDKDANFDVFKQYRLTAPPVDAIELVVGDLNGDGRDDVAFGEASRLSLYYQEDGGVLTRKFVFEELANLSQLALGDINGDGTVDIAGTMDSPMRMVVLVGDGTGGFAVQYDVEIDEVANGIAIVPSTDGSNAHIFASLSSSLLWLQAPKGLGDYGSGEIDLRTSPDGLEMTDIVPFVGVEMASATDIGVVFFHAWSGGIPGMQTGMPSPPDTTEIRSGRFSSTGEASQLALLKSTESVAALTLVYEPPTMNSVLTFRLDSSPTDIASGRLNDDELDDIVIVDGSKSPKIYLGK